MLVSNQGYSSDIFTIAFIHALFLFKLIVISESFAFVISLPDYRHLSPIYNWFCDIQFQVANKAHVYRKIRYLLVLCLVISL